jgi:hypothetical protein
MSINLALRDAATCCIQENAKATLLMMSGHTVEGKLQHYFGDDTVQIASSTGWSTVLVREIAGVSVEQQQDEEIGTR